MQDKWGRTRRIGQGSRDGAGRRKRDTVGGVVLFPSSSLLVVNWDNLGAG